MSPQRPGIGWSFVFAALIGLSVFAFLRGTDPGDYDLTPPLSQWVSTENPEVPTALSYAQMRQRPMVHDVTTACTDCHDDRVSPVDRSRHTEHPIGVAIPQGADLASLSEAGGRTEMDTDHRPLVSCQTCHRPHNPDSPSQLVAEAADGTLCLSCHADHGPSRSRHPVTGRISAATRTAVTALTGESASGLGCMSCHAVHDAKTGPLLRTDRGGSGSCTTCHRTATAALAGKGHGGKYCQDCHGMHAKPAHVGRGPKPAKIIDQPCVSCHMDGGRRGQIPVTGHLAWSDSTGCHDCHVAHGSANDLLVRSSVSKTCVECHEDQQTAVGTRHDSTVSSAITAGQSCVACHDVHGRSGDRPSAPADANPASGRCLACHDGRTQARAIPEWDHPSGFLLTAEGLPARYKGVFEFFDPNGLPTTNRATGSITCQSCHDPHRWKHNSTEVPGDAEGTEQNSFLRKPDDVVVFCTTCHGVDGRLRYRFFHDRARFGD